MIHTSLFPMYFLGASTLAELPKGVTLFSYTISTSYVRMILSFTISIFLMFQHIHGIFFCPNLKYNFSLRKLLGLVEGAVDRLNMERDGLADLRLLIRRPKMFFFSPCSFNPMSRHLIIVTLIYFSHMNRYPRDIKLASLSFFLNIFHSSLSMFVNNGDNIYAKIFLSMFGLIKSTTI